MKLKDTFISHNSNGENILIDVTGENFSGIVRSNPTAAYIIDCLASETTEDEIAAKMLGYFEGATDADVRKDIALVIANLRKIEALDE